jgi:ubiquitin-conjugating enzyme E2 Q
MNGALCMELLTSEGWNPVNDIESVIVSIRSLLVVGDGRLSAAVEMSKEAREAALAAAKEKSLDRKGEEDSDAEGEPSRKRHRQDDSGDERGDASSASKKSNMKVTKTAAGHYSASEARAAYSHLSEYHKKKGWDSSGWWARKG